MIKVTIKSSIVISLRDRTKHKTQKQKQNTKHKNKNKTQNTKTQKHKNKNKTQNTKTKTNSTERQPWLGRWTEKNINISLDPSKSKFQNEKNFHRLVVGEFDIRANISTAHLC